MKTTGLPEQRSVLIPTAGPVSYVDDATRERNQAAGINDYSFVPGYSDKRAAREVAKRRGETGPVLTHRFQWVRTKKANGNPDMRAAFGARARGYVPVKVDDLPSLGIAMLPSGVPDANGEISMMDTTLYVCTAKQAAQNERARRRAIDANAESYDQAVGIRQEAVRLQGPGAAETLVDAEHTVTTDNVGPDTRR